MHKARAFFYVCALLPCIAVGMQVWPTPTAAAQGVPIGSLGFGNGGLGSWIVVFDNGDVIHGTAGACPGCPPVWTSAGNVFASAGHSPEGQRLACGISPGFNPAVMSSTGDQYSDFGNGWQFDFNIFAESGRPAEEVVSFSGNGGGHFTVTAGGSLFVGSVYIGNIYGAPVAAMRGTWGDLKVRYR